MVIEFPIPTHFNETVFASGLASLLHRPGFSGHAITTLRASGALLPGPPVDPVELQRHLYEVTIDQMRDARSVIGRGRGGDDLYVLPWFLCSFHCWVVIGEQHGFARPPWLGQLDDIEIIHEALYDVGIDDSVQTLRARLAKNGNASSLQAVDELHALFLDQVKYLSSAAVRR